MSRIAVMGTGSWGTTFALVLADAGHEVRMWGRRAEVCDEINDKHRNGSYLGEVDLPETITASTDPAHVLEGTRYVVLAVPSQSLRANLTDWAPFVDPEARLISLMKGIELDTQERMSEVIAEVLKAGPERVVVVSGPNLAKEIAQRQPTATVVACSSPQTAEEVAELCSTGYFRPYTNTDVCGVELGGAIKNVIALAIGMTDGLGLGDNTKASLITRGLAETTRLGFALGALPSTMAGLAGLGDLVATCASPLSRNRTFGRHLGEGLSVDEVRRLTNQTAEGVTSCRSILALGKRYGVDMPITEQVTLTVSGEAAPEQIAERFLSRARKHENF